MLLSAKFENIYSFNEETRILFTASKSDQLPLQVSRAEKRDDISVLRMGLIYGANASGKSNIIKCLAIIKEFALNGWSNLKYNYFKMTDEPQERSSIELEFNVHRQFCRVYQSHEFVPLIKQNTPLGIYLRRPYTHQTLLRLEGYPRPKSF